MAERYEHTIAPFTRKLFDKLATTPWIADFYLAGGTALALQLGHRTSVDLDFFSETSFDESRLLPPLASIGILEVLQTAPQSIIGTLDGVKISFLEYRYPLLKAPTELDRVKIASIEDIAAMKLNALARRGTKRDFVDVYFIAKRQPLSEQLRLFQTKYNSVGFNLVHLKKSLVFFEDAESEPMPAMLVPTEWREVKNFFVEEAPGLAAI